jgi:hypothetical protein
VIRTVVVGVVNDGVDAERVEAALQALRDLTMDGEPVGIVAGRDLGLREGNASYSLTVDFPDEDAYRRYDLDEEHNRIRRELFAPISREIRRIQFRLP